MTGTGGAKEGFLPIGDSANPFTGSFDGDEHVISALYINRGGTERVGLFGSSLNADIRNVGVENVNIVGYESVGSLIGWADSTTVERAYSSGSVTVNSTSAGGLIGVTKNGGSVLNSYSTADAHSDGWGAAAGLIYHSESLVSNCYATGHVSGGNLCAGLVGVNASTIVDCYATGDVTIWGGIGGGLVGNNHWTITTCYASGTVIGGNTVGGWWAITGPRLKFHLPSAI